MLHLIKEAGLEEEFVIDSAGILSYHQGELPDSRMRAHAARRGYQLVHRSRPVRTEDFYNFDLIIDYQQEEKKPNVTHPNPPEYVCFCPRSETQNQTQYLSPRP